MCELINIKNQKISLNILFCNIFILGPTNDLINILDKNYEVKMKQFREKHSLVGQGQGGALNGKGVEKVISEKGLSDLTNMLPDSVAEPVVKYLRSIRAVYKICVSKSLDPDYQTVFDEFWKNFLVLKEHPDIQLSMTPKVHDIVHHIPQYCYNSQEYIRSLHRNFTPKSRQI